MKRFTAAERLLGALLLTLPVVGQAQVIHNTGVVQLEVRCDGFIGASGTFGGTGFVFNGANGLFEGQLLVGRSATQVSGEAYADDLPDGQGPPEWFCLSGPDAIPNSSIPPYEEFPTGYSAVFDDSAAPNPIGVDVVQDSYSTTVGPDNGYVVTAFTVRNTTTSPLNGIYIGIFADLDVGDFTTNLAGYNSANRLLYVYDSSDPSTDYFGMSLLGWNPVSGYEFDVGAGFNPTEADLYAALSSGADVPPTTPDDRRTVLGSGPYNLAPGASVVVPFAWAAGNDLAAINAAGTAARAAVPSTPYVAALAPRNPPAGVPAGGGALPYSATIRNTTGSPQTFDAWVTATLPNGTVFPNPVAGPVTVTLPGGAAVTQSLSGQVPALAPNGTYALTLRVGSYPGTTVHSSSFTFTKGAAGPIAGGGAPGGVPFIQEGVLSFSSPSAEASAAGLTPGVAATPNPFTAATTLRYTIGEAQAVRLAVYDVLGREVAVLVDGSVEAGAHEALFDGRGLAPGVYVVRLTAGTQLHTQRITLAQ